MASTSTNKQPLLVDRPLHVVVDLKNHTIADGAVIDIGGTNSATLLVDCTKNDGATIDDVYTYAREIATPATEGYEVVLYLSSANDFLRPGQGMMCGIFVAGDALAEKIRWKNAPNIYSPTPKVGSIEVEYEDALGETQPGDVIGTSFRGLYIPKGRALWGAVVQQSADDTAETAPLIGLQGGFF